MDEKFKDTSKNKIKSFGELSKEVKASWSDDAWSVYEAASKSFQEDTNNKDKNQNNE